MNTLGRLLRLSTWGESHGIAIGGMLDGLPSGIQIDLEQIQRDMDRRRPGQSALTSSRDEADRVEILSGLSPEGITLGSPISLIIRNADHRSKDYDSLTTTYRPGHADYTYKMKYGIREAKGGGRSSARETAIRVATGSIAYQWLRTLGIEIAVYAEQIGSTAMHRGKLSWEQIQRRASTPLRCPDAIAEEAMTNEILRARAENDSVGGIVVCRVRGVPMGLGEPIYDKLHARLAQAMLSINAVRAFELGDGFALAEMRGSEANDTIRIGADGKPYHETNHSGGVLGGISNGEELMMRLAFKPAPTIGLPQRTITSDYSETMLEAIGRHDPCVVPRALQVVEAMCALTLADFILLSQATQR